MSSETEGAFSLDLTADVREMRDWLHEFAEKVIRPAAAEWDEREETPWPILEEAAKIGLYSLDFFAQQWLEPSGLGTVVAFEELFWGDAGIALSLVGSGLAAIAVSSNGTSEQIGEWLPQMFGSPGDPKLAAFCSSEPGAGSDVANIKTTARKDGDDYVINGSKMWITNSLQADWMCLLANTEEGAAHKNKSLIMVPMSTPGITKAKKIRKIGMMASDTGLIHFDDVRVPQTNRVGEEGMGFTYQMMQFQEERLWAAAHAIQALGGCIRSTIDYTRERQIFGRSVLDHQVVHYKLAELKTEVEALRGLVYMATEKYVGGADVTEWASMAKLKACRLGRLVPDACMQYWGGMGYTWDNPVARYFRDGRLGSIAGGADEVMLGIIAKYMHTLPARG